MHLPFILALAALPLAAQAGNQHLRAHRHAARAYADANAPARRAKSFNLVQKSQGQNFFDDWSFFTQPDPTHGQVTFVGGQQAASSKLAFVQSDNTAVIGVDSTTTLGPNQPRNAVRIQSNAAYDTGLFIADMYVPFISFHFPRY